MKISCHIYFKQTHIIPTYKHHHWLYFTSPVQDSHYNLHFTFTLQLTLCIYVAMQCSKQRLRTAVINKYSTSQAPEMAVLFLKEPPVSLPRDPGPCSLLIASLPDCYEEGLKFTRSFQIHFSDRRKRCSTSCTQVRCKRCAGSESRPPGPGSTPCELCSWQGMPNADPPNHSLCLLFSKEQRFLLL